MGLGEGLTSAAGTHRAGAGGAGLGGAAGPNRTGTGSGLSGTLSGTRSPPAPRTPPGPAPLAPAPRAPLPVPLSVVLKGQRGAQRRRGEAAVGAAFPVEDGVPDPRTVATSPLQSSLPRCAPPLAPRRSRTLRPSAADGPEEAAVANGVTHSASAVPCGSGVRHRGTAPGEDGVTAGRGLNPRAQNATGRQGAENSRVTRGSGALHLLGAPEGPDTSLGGGTVVHCRTWGVNQQQGWGRTEHPTC